MIHHPDPAPDTFSRILVDISDFQAEGTRHKRRARRVNVQLPDNPAAPCLLEVELIPYALLPDGSYGKELTTGNFRRKLLPKPLTVDNNRLIDISTGEIVASRYKRDGLARPDADWQADVARMEADKTVLAMFQADWFCSMMEQGNDGKPINTFIRQYIQLADLSGDFD